MKKPIIVAMDGPAGAGKSTVAKTLAKKLGYLHIDTGAMYRSVTLAALRTKADLKNDDQLERLAKSSKIELKPGEVENKVFLNGEDVSKDIRTPEVTQASAFIANCVPVRKILVARQQQMGREDSVSYGGAVLEGRDIGTDVFPDAQYKFFLDASVETRAKRRYNDLVKAGTQTTLEAVLADVQARDDRDYNRAVGGLRKTADSIVMDHSDLTVEQSAEELFQYIQKHPKN
ncbi:MAG TPA: (d)CMP kinase [bacterium]|jgi:cytidylate kinase|nr:(d)CMP kinase [bacterium]